ncbi:MAG: cell division protein FtsB [Candidatus Sedimenticola sp. (ex Thyasira tokunagai)]
MRLLTALLLLIILVLQYRLWVGEGSLAEVHSLKKDIALQKGELKQMRLRNRALQAEVDDLKKGLEAIEERARNELGMIREGEIFYQVVEPTGEQAK